MNMKSRPFLLLISFLWSASASAQEPGQDVLLMKNGDKITGDIKGLTDGILSVKLAYVQGNVSVQWSQVESVHSDHLFLVKNQAGEVFSGKLNTTTQTAEDTVSLEIVNSPEQVVSVSQERVVSITPTAERFWQRLDGAVNTNLLYSRGNQSLQYSVSSQVVFNTPRWHSQVDMESTLASNAGADVANRNRGSVNSLRLIGSKNWFFGGGAALLQSSVQKIHAQTTLGAGFGRYLKNTNRVSISLLGGLGWQNTDYTGLPSGEGVPNTAVSFLSTNLKVFKFKKTNLNVSATVLPAISEIGRVHLNTNVIYYIKIIGDLSYNVSFYGNWDNRPPLSVPGSDYGSSSGLTWTFGNR
jgi:putative salt-induced outer membrane protein YdiY